MAAGQKLYPRATVKKIVKAHSKRNVSKNVDVLVGFTTRLPEQLLTGFPDIPGLCSIPTDVCDPFISTLASRDQNGTRNKNSLEEHRLTVRN